MSNDPWTSADPQPGDLDSDLAELDPRYAERRDGEPDGKLMILVSVEGKDAERLQRLSARQGKTSADVVADLLRSADGRWKPPVRRLLTRQAVVGPPG